jgi:hypothetical protein
MKKLTSHDQQKIASMVYSHQVKLNEAYPQIFVRPNLPEVLNMVQNLIPLDPTYQPINESLLPKRGPKAK